MTISLRASFLVAAAIAGLAGCGGGGDDCTIVYPTPDYDFFTYRGLDAADINGDGFADLVMASALIFGTNPQYRECGATVENGADGYVTVLLQDMSNPGTFGTPLNYPLRSSGGVTLKLADLNADMYPDVIVTHRWGDKIFDVLINNSATPGELGPEETYTTVFQPGRVATGDIDLDGDIDIAVGGESAIAWHAQESGLDFSARNNLGLGSNTLALVDFDQNGLLDIVTHDSTVDSDLLIYTQATNLPGAFDNPVEIPTDIAIRTLAAGDLNEDNRPDIAAARFDDYWYRVLQTSTQPLSFMVHKPRLEAKTSFSVVPIIADLNGDEKEDVVIPADDRVTVFLQGDVPGEYESASVYKLPPPTRLSTNGLEGLAVADLNGDLLPDIAVSNNEVLVLFQRPGQPGTFQQAMLILGTEPL